MLQMNDSIGREVSVLSRPFAGNHPGGLSDVLSGIFQGRLDRDKKQRTATVVVLL